MTTTPFSREEKRLATIDVMNHVCEVLFYFFNQEQDEDITQDDGALTEFVGYMWDISIASMASIGMNITGKNEDGSYNAIFKPVESVKEFLINDDTAEEGQPFMEDIVADVVEGYDPELGEVEINLGLHEEKLLGD